MGYEKIAFIDAKEWLGQGTSLREFLKCFGEDDDDQKLFFPYELVDSVRALEGPFPCLLYTSPSPRDRQKSRMPSSA